MWAAGLATSDYRSRLKVSLAKPSGVACAAGFGAEPKPSRAPSNIGCKMHVAASQSHGWATFPTVGLRRKGRVWPLPRLASGPKTHLLPYSVGAALYATLELAAAGERAP